jgi:hypothetical protein
VEEVESIQSLTSGDWTIPQVNLIYPADNLGTRKARRGHQEHATYLISIESYYVNTGDLMKDDKEGGSRKARAV